MSKNQIKKGRIFIISAPSGSGKTTLCKRLLRRVAGLTHSVSMTTRPPRAGEKNKRDYYFVSKDKFQKWIKEKKLLEWTRTYGWYYGTPRENVENLLKKGKDVLLSIDVKGAACVKRIYPDSVLIFIAPPSLEELKARLQKRASDARWEIKKRLKTARKELSCAGMYDYSVINDKISQAVAKLKAIVIAERRKDKTG